MKIAFLDPSDWDYTIESVYQKPMGGSQSALCYLAERLAQQGHEIFLLNNTSMPGRWRGVSCLSLPLNRVPRDVLRSLDAVIVLNVAGHGLKLRKFFGDRIRLILWTQQLPILSVMQPLENLAERSVYDGIALVSEWQRDRFVDYFGIDRDRTAVLRNAIAPTFGNLFPPGTSILARKSQPPILAYTSTPFRGLDLLLEVFPKIRQAVPGTRLKVFSSLKVYQVSEQLNESAFGLLYQKCRDTEGVEYVGSIPQPELARELCKVSVLAYPSTFQETSCIAVMEAIASGCRIVTSDLAGLSETSGRFARLVSVEDVLGFSSGNNWEFSLREDWKTYANRFIEATVQVLRECQGTGAESLLRQQVDSINHSCTWEVRSQQWVEWLSHLCGFSELSTEVLPLHENVEALNRQADENYRQGKFSEAIAACQHALKINANDALSYKILGNILQAQGKIEPAIRAYFQAIEFQPNFVEAHANLGSMYYLQGRLEEAIACYQKVIEINPHFSAIYWNLAKVLQKGGRTNEALVYMQKALEFEPQQVRVESCNELCYSLIEEGKLREASGLYQKLIAIQPHYAPGYLNLGTVLKKQGKLEEAIACFKQALTFQSDFAEAYYNLGNTLGEQNKWEEAIAYFQKYLNLKPNDAEGYSRVAAANVYLEKFEEAIAYFQKAIQMEPNDAHAYLNLGLALQQQARQQKKLDRDRAHQAIASLNRAIELQPDLIEAHQNLIELLMTSRDTSGDLTLLSAARKAADRYLKFCHKKYPILSTLAYIKAYRESGLSHFALEKFLPIESTLLNSVPKINIQEISKLYTSLLFSMPHLRDNLAANSTLSKWIGYRYAEGLSSHPSVKGGSLRNGGEKNATDLKIGFLSENFKKHSVGWCSYAAIAALSQLNCRIFLYGTGNFKVDVLTEKFKNICEKMVIFKEVNNPGFKIQKIIDTIAEENLDILIDLDSLTVPIHAEILKARPAAVCISWLGFDAPFISDRNYFLGDWHTHPIGTERYYTEKLLRMPDSFVAIAGFESIPCDRETVRKSLDIDSKQVVYLCLTPGRKFNTEMVRACVQILKQVSDSVLIYKGQGDRSVIESAYQQECESHDVSFSRIKFVPRTPTEEEHRKIYLCADVLLDSYPYNGGTHTLEALWFNLPMVTRTGEQFLSRMGYSFLKTLGIDAGVAWSWEEYVEWGIRFGRDRDLREAIRNRLLKSKHPESLAPLWNLEKFSRDMNALFTEILTQ